MACQWVLCNEPRIDALNESKDIILFFSSTVQIYFAVWRF